jgi:hypothetical protein
MYYTIQHFIEKDIKEIEKSVGKIIIGEIDAEDLSREIQERVLKLGTDLLGEIYELLDDEIRESISRKKHWTIEHRNQEKTILDVMGKVTFKRTGYCAKGTNEYIYLLDKVLGFEPGQKLTLRAAANALEETIESSYMKGGRKASLTEEISKQAVKDLVHGTIVEMPIKEPKDKKRAKYLHIVADEDHVSAQFQEEKGDLPRDSRGNKINTIMPKLICLYEDIINVSGEVSENPRYKLIGKRYFSGTYVGSKANEELWNQVARYIDTVYDTEYLERVYIAGDGAPWIKSGCEYIENSKFVLDKFHMMKYVNTSVTPLLDSAEEGKEEIWEALNSADKDALKEVYKRILDVTEDGKKKENIKKALKYFLNNWDGIKIKVEDADGCWGCCAEGQVSHVLSDRMSSRPMGWSRFGCDQMAKFRAFKYNNGKVIDLLKYQKEKQKEQEHREEQEELIKELRKRKSGWNYAERTQAVIPGLEKSNMKWMRSLIDSQVI